MAKAKSINTDYAKLLRVSRAFLIEKLERLDAERLECENDAELIAFINGQISMIDEIFENEE